jgi:two-component system response regulator DesR
VIRIVVVGGLRVPEGSLSVLLGQDTGIDIVGHVSFDDDVVSTVVASCASVVVINADYMVSQVLPLVADIRVRDPYVGILMLIDPEKPGMLPTRRRSDGLSFLVKNVTSTSIAEAVRRLADGERVVEPHLEVAILGQTRLVSTRELEVLGLAAEGSSIAEIAGRLYLAPGTVRNYISAAITKTGARNRIDAIRIARRGGWLH